MEAYIKLNGWLFIYLLSYTEKKNKKEGSQVKIEREKCFLIVSLTLYNISLQIGTKWLASCRSGTSISSGLQISAYAICEHEYAWGVTEQWGRRNLQIQGTFIFCYHWIKNYLEGQ